MLKRSLIWGAFLLCLCTACVQDRIGGDELNGPGGSIPTGLVMDSLEFLIVDADVLKADSLLSSGSRPAALTIYDSLLQTGIGDPYLHFHISAQKLSASYRKMEVAERGDSLASLKQLSQSLDEEPFYLKLELAVLEGNIAFRAKEYLQVVKGLDFLKSIEIRNYGPHLNKLIYDGCLRIGRANFNGFQNYYRAKDWFNKQAKMATFMPELSQKSLGVLNYLMAGVSRNLNDFELGLSYCDKAITHFDNAEYFDARQSAIARSEQVVLLSKLKKHEESARAFSTLLEIAEEGNLNDNLIFTFIKNYAGVLFEDEQVEDYEEILTLLERRMNPVDTSQLADVIERKAWLSELNGEYQKLAEFQRDALNLYASYSEMDDWDLAEYCSNLGLALMEVGELDSAIHYLHKGVQLTVQEDFPIKDPPLKLNLSAYRNFKHDLAPLALALQKSSFPTGDLGNNMKLAERYYDLIFLLFEKYKSGREEGAILRDLGDFHPIFGEAIACKYFSNKNQEEKQKEIYEIMEKGKATLLFRSIYLRAMADQFGLPDTLFQSLIDVNQQISELDETGFEGDDKINYSNLVRGKENILSEIEYKFPEFSKAVRTPDQITLDQIQNALGSKQILIQYYWSTQGLFVIGITREEIRLKHCEQIDSLEDDLTDFLKIIQTPPQNTSTQNVERYSELAYHLDTTLFSDVLPDDGIEEIIIIPDGPISGLPFETLIEKKSKLNSNSFFDLKYRVRNYSISYGFSGSLFYHQNKPYRPSRKPDIQLFAYTDHELVDYNNLDSISMELPASSFEVDAVGLVLNKYKTSIWKGQDCKKEVFEKGAINSDILHLALHAKSNPDNRFGNHIIFPEIPNSPKEDYILFSHELKKLNLKAKFVFLSACEAGFGKSEIGEGIYSLGRGFANAGVPSLVMGMWEINDQISAKMVERFYKSLSEGTKINRALQIAKKSCLANSVGIIAHPYYWAPLISIGGTQCPLK